MKHDQFKYLARMFNESFMAGINDGWSNIDDSVKQFVKEHCENSFGAKFVIENFKMEPLDGCDSS